MSGVSPREAICVAQVVLNLDVGGLERVVIDLVNHLDRARFQPVVFCLGDGGVLQDRVRDAGCPVHAFNKGPGVSASLPLRMQAAIRDAAVDVVHCHNVPALLYGAVASRLAGKGSVVYTPHGVESATNPQVAWYRRLGLIERIVAVSEDARSLSISASGFAPGATETVPNGIDVDAYAAADAAGVRASLGIDVGIPVIGIVARLAPEKDHKLLLEAMATLRRSIDPVVLLVIGGGELRVELEARAAELALDGCVRFLGMRSDVSELLAALDVFVLSSRTEGMSVTLLEAMAAARPIVATDVGGNAEVVRDGDTGLIVPPGDATALAKALASILRDPGAARRMGERGRERVVADFSVKVMAKRYEDVYDRVLASRH